MDIKDWHTITHPWYDGHSTNINAYRVWGGKGLGFKSLEGSFTHIYT